MNDSKANEAAAEPPRCGTCTCERRRALEFLRKIYPSLIVEDTDESVKDLLDIIEADEIRVCDPDYHSERIIQSSNWNDTTLERAMAALRKNRLEFAR